MARCSVPGCWVCRWCLDSDGLGCIRLVSALLYFAACSRVRAHLVRDVFSNCPLLGWGRQLPCCLMFGSRCNLLPPLLGRAGQQLSVSPRCDSLLLRHVSFPCPHVLSRLPLAGCVGFPLLGCLRCVEQVGSVGFPLTSFPGSFDVLRLSGRRCACTAALHPPVLPRSYLAAGVTLTFLLLDTRT